MSVTEPSYAAKGRYGLQTGGRRLAFPASLRTQLAILICWPWLPVILPAYNAYGDRTESAPKLLNLKFKRRGITQNNECHIQ
jgi:hypothetical protein